MHDPCLHGINVGREVVYEVVLRQPGEALLVNVEVRQRRTQRPLPQQRADRLALIKSERSRATSSASAVIGNWVR
jgi:hypothetical protein